MEIIDILMNSLLNLKDIIIATFTNPASLIKFIVLYFFVIWWAFIIWIVKDITNRTTNVFLQVFSILIVIFLTPIFWLPIYLLIRPRSTIFEKYYEEEEFDEEDILEEEIVNEEYACPRCGKDVKEDFQFCPYCELKLTKGCSKCGKSIKIDWKICPYCGNHEITEQFKKAPMKQGVKVDVQKLEKKKKQDILKDLETEDEE